MDVVREPPRAARSALSAVLIVVVGTALAVIVVRGLFAINAMQQFMEGVGIDSPPPPK